MKKKLAIILCAAVMASVLAGCGGKNNSSEPASTDEASVQTEAAVNEDALTVPANNGLVIADNAVEFAKNLKMGWNLGNTLDANSSKDLSSETSWGQPKATKELISYVKEAGFTSIRIPVSWGNHMDADYNIDAEWMKRVTEVVNYALEADLYVIINTHHDCDYYYPSDEKYESSEKYIKAVWTQLCENFKDYDERLVFESMNEPRLMGTNKEWWFSENDEEGVASIKCIVKLNQVFVDTVRAADGYNKSRFLMVPSHAASPDTALNNAFVMPEDPSGRLMVSVHAYTPYDFAMNDKGYKDWDGSHAGDLNFMDRLNSKFIANGYGVVIGEFGATNKDNLEARIAWAKAYTEKAAGFGIPCFLWDNGGTKVGSENFGMIDRASSEIFYPDILSQMMASYN